MASIINASNSAGVQITSDTSGVIQFQSSGANTIQIAANGTMLTSTGSVVGATNLTVTTYTSGSGTWTKPSTGTFARVRLWGGGGSGAKHVGTTTGASCAGGAGGAYVENIYLLSELNATESYSVAAGGTAVTATTTTQGNPGGNSTFKGLTAYGGQGGGTGTGSKYYGGGLFGVGLIAQPFTGDLPVSPWDGGSTSDAGGLVSFYGGGGGGSATTYASPGAAGLSSVGGNGGAANTTSGGIASTGSAPAGGGGAKGNGTGGSSGAGGAGRVEIWVW